MNTASTTATRDSDVKPVIDSRIWDVAALFDFHPEDGNANERGITLRDQGYVLTGQRPGVCGHCGASLRYGALLAHKHSRELLLVGELCLGSRFPLRGEFDALRDRARAVRERRANARRTEQRIAALVAVDAAFSVFGETDHDAITSRYGTFVGDIATQVTAGRPLTDRQIRATLNSIRRTHLEAAAGSRRAADGQAVPTGQQTVVGTVLNHKIVTDDRYHKTTHKVRIRDDRGYIVWGTCPSALVMDDTDPTGRRVMFSALLTRSDDDPRFGFYKSPKGAKYLQQH